MSKLIERKDYTQRLDRATSGLKENTKRAYYADVTDYMRSAASWGVEAAKVYFKHLAAAGYSPATIRRKRAVLSLFANILVEAGEIQVNPFRLPSFRTDMRKVLQTSEKATKRRGHKPGAHYIREEKLAEMLRVAGDDLRGKRDRVILLLGAGEGLRRSEISNLRWADIERDDSGKLHLIIRAAKSGTGKVRLFPAVAKALEELREAYEKAHITTKHVVVSLSRNDTRGGQLRGYGINTIVRKYARRVNADNADEITAHDLRHTFAVSLHTKNVPIASISKMLRHSDVKITLHYLSTLNVIDDPALEAIADSFMSF